LARPSQKLPTDEMERARPKKEEKRKTLCVCVLTRYAVRAVTQKLRDGQLRAPSAKEKNFFFF
jgi:hypothetical protein